MLDHVTYSVSNIEAAKKFYTEALAPIGYRLRHEFAHGGADIVGIGSGESAIELWFYAGEKTVPRVHMAFRADTREQVDEFYRLALAAGGSDNGAPGIRSDYGPNYYAAFVLDPDGNNVELVHNKL